jgi:glycerol uptake facilitator-like aquaporin
MTMQLLKNWTFSPQPNLLSKFFAEFTACAIFHFLGSLSPTAITNGVALIVLVYYCAKTSGSHLNPALTVTFSLLGYTNPIEVLVYWLAQFSGSIIGALWISILVPGLDIGTEITEYNYQHAGCFDPMESLTKWDVFGWECIGTMCFFLPIFSVVWYTLHEQGYGSVAPVMVGLSLIANALAIGTFTGAAFNPARVIGSPAIFKCDNRFMWWYIFGEFVGACIVPFIIAPWYGICPHAWYMDLVSTRTRTILDKVQVDEPANTDALLHALYEQVVDSGNEVIRSPRSNGAYMTGIGAGLLTSSGTNTASPTPIQMSPHGTMQRKTLNVNTDDHSYGGGAQYSSPSYIGKFYGSKSFFKKQSTNQNPEITRDRESPPKVPSDASSLESSPESQDKSNKFARPSIGKIRIDHVRFEHDISRMQPQLQTKSPMNKYASSSSVVDDRTSIHSIPELPNEEKAKENIDELPV